MAAEEPDAATAALIAKMMAEENPYDDDVYGMYADDSDDDDYGRPRKKKKNAKPKAAPKPPKEPKPPKAPKAPKPPPPTGEDGEALSASGRRKRKDTGAVRQKARPWTEEEEKLFLEALALHGRDWKKCAEHVGTRDHRAFTSHAQKWFIKMCLQGKPLPKKVAESGEGYTLSGKPLDPNSAAARQYGFRADTLIAFDTVPDEDAPPESLVGRELARDDDSEIVPLGGNVASYDAEKLAFEIATRDAEGALSSAFVADSPAFRARLAPRAPLTAAEMAAELEEQRLKDAEAREAAAEAAREAKAAAAAARVEKREKLEIEKLERAAARAEKTARKAAEEAARRSAAAPSSEPTEYARNRPRRELAVSGGAFRDASGGTLELHPPRAFAPGPPGGANAQPFTVDVTPAAMLVMDAHAHLCTNEVIGYLGGTWDASAKRLTILKAFPGRGLASGSDVEMDPVAEVELKTQVEASEMCVVGWYHSHPVFEPNPSGVDVDNQLNYQKLFTDETCGVAPFVGFIVGPYDLRLPTRVSAVTAFVASRKKGPGGALEDVPYEAKFTVTDEAPGEAVTEALASVVDANKSTAGRINPTELWRPFTNFTNKQPAGGPCTKLAKLRASLAVRLPEETMDETARENILDGLAKRVQTSWGVDLGY